MAALAVVVAAAVGAVRSSFCRLVESRQDKDSRGGDRSWRRDRDVGFAVGYPCGGRTKRSNTGTQQTRDSERKKQRFAL